MNAARSSDLAYISQVEDQGLSPIVRIEGPEVVPAVRATVVIPALNEEESVGSVVRRVRDVLGPNDEIIVVNDGSTDNTAAVAEAAGAKVHTKPYRYGNGSAIKTGARLARGEFVIMLDADGQHDPAMIPVMLEQAERYDMVVAARSMDSHASFGRKVANKVFNGLASRLSGRKIEDLTSGYRLVRRSVLMQFLTLLPNQFSYPTTITLASLKAGYTVNYIPIHAAKRAGKEKSKIRPVSDGVNFLQIIFKIMTLYAPMKIFAPVSAVPAIAGGLCFLAWVVIGLGSSATWLLLLCMSVVLFGMGLISEQIAALRFERHGDHGLV